MKKKTLLLWCAFAGTVMTSVAQTYDFNNASASGRFGPTQAQVNSAYVGTSLDGLVTVTGQGIQQWVVPSSGNYSISAVGSCGGELQGTFFPGLPGTGASISGEFYLTSGTIINVVVGQKGTYGDNGSGGGGGTFVYSGNPGGAGLLVAAGGGGGHGHGSGSVPSGAHGGGGSATTAIVNGAYGTGNGGSPGVGLGGNPGSGCSFGGHGAGGAGWSSNGGLPTCGAATGGNSTTFVGGDGGIDLLHGGFGGGGGSDGNGSPGGGGGGYTGGGGGNDYSGSVWGAGAGAGSFNSGSNQTNIAGVTGATSGYTHGSVTIISLCNPSVGSLAADLVSLQDITEDCVSTPTAPTASNDCVGGIVGTPDIAFPITAVGTTVVTWTYTDGTNTITQTQNVIINGIDGTPPVVNNASLPDLSGQCDLTPPTPLATDACAGTILGVADVTFPLNAQGLTVITWTYDDGNGNTTTQTQNITLNDVAPPNLDNASLPDYNGCGAATPPTPTATDYCMGTINGVPDVTFPITAAGPTTVTWTYDDGNGNTTTQTQDVYSTMMDLSVSLAGTTITANAIGVSYAWIDCGTNQEIAGETGQTYTPSVTGQYAVVITNGTCVDTSECTLVDFTGIDEIVSKMFRIYPNPNNGQFIVDIDSEEAYEITIHDIAGKVIYRNASISNEKNEVSLGKLEGGTYYVTIENETSKATRKMVVN